SIKAEHSPVEAEEIAGDFRVDSSSDRVRVNRINGVLWVKSKNGAVEVEEVRGLATIEATRDVTVRDFRGPLSVTSRDGVIELETAGKLNGDLTVSSYRASIRVSLPHDT